MGSDRIPNMDFRTTEGHHPNPVQVDVEEANKKEARKGRSWIRNAAGDLLERCTGHRCNLGGRKTKRKRRKKTKKGKTNW